MTGLWSRWLMEPQPVAELDVCRKLQVSHFVRFDIIIGSLQRPRGLRRGCAAASLPGLRVRIPLGTGMFVVIVVCCQVEVSATGWSLVRRSPTDCGVSECNRGTSTIRRSRSEWGCQVMTKRNSFQQGSLIKRLSILLFVPFVFVKCSLLFVSVRCAVSVICHLAVNLAYNVQYWIQLLLTYETRLDIFYQVPYMVQVIRNEDWTVNNKTLSASYLVVTPS